MFDHFLNQSIIAIRKMANFPNYKFWEFSKLDIFGIQIFFLIWKIIKIPKIGEFRNCSSIWYFALFAILSIFILPFDINFIFYCGDTRKFGHSTFARSLIFQFEIPAVLKFYCPKFWPSPIAGTLHCRFKTLWIKCCCNIDISLYIVVMWELSSSFVGFFK